MNFSARQRVSGGSAKIDADGDGGDMGRRSSGDGKGGGGGCMSSKGPVSTTMNEYSQASSVHGIAYVFEKGQVRTIF